MHTRLLIIQTIKEDGSIDVFQTESDNFQWSFDIKGAAAENSPEYFPFIIRHANTFKRESGAETEVTVSDDTILFQDDYSIPDGSVVGIMFPKNYILDVLKFKDFPNIPVGLIGQVVARPPGQMQIVYNSHEKRSAILLHIHQRMLFRMSCLAKQIKDEVLPNKDNWVYDDFDVSISRELLAIDEIRTDDLNIINKAINKVDIEDVNNTLNEILAALKNRDKEKAKSGISKFGKSISNGIGVAANMTKLIDSYQEGGAPHQFISQLLKYESL